MNGLAVDGLNTIWASTTKATSSLVNLTSNPTLNYGNPNIQLLLPTTSSSVAALAIDGSGNIWLANGSTGGLVEVVGAAAPLTTPRAIAVKNSTLATRP